MDLIEKLYELCDTIHESIKFQLSNRIDERLDYSLTFLKEELLKQAKELAEEEKRKAEIKTICIVDNKKHLVNKIEGKTHPKFDRILRLANARLNILLIGPAGSGKTYLAKQISEALKLDFGFISCSSGMSEGQLLGRLLPTGDSGRFEYSQSNFVRIYEGGGVFLLDEIDAADPNTILVLNTSLANGHLCISNRIDNPVANKHPDFICICAANTYGTGADRQYVGRNQLDEAFLDRFRIGQVTIDYDSKLEEYLCPDNIIRRRLQHYRENINKSLVRRIISSRFLKEAYTALVHGFTDEEIDEALFGGWRQDEIYKTKEGVKIDQRRSKNKITEVMDYIDLP